MSETAKNRRTAEVGCVKKRSITMSKPDIVRAWKDDEYFNKLSEVRAVVVAAESRRSCRTDGSGFG
jgi:hypothetical protein